MLVARFALVSTVACALVAASLGAATASDAATAPASSAPDFVVAADQAVVWDFAGFGSQLNQHVYADLSGPPPGLADLEAKVLAARPPLVRIFFNTTAWTNPDRLLSFHRTVALANRSGATMNVTWQGSGVPFALANMGRFADVLRDVVQGTGVSAVWVTLFNEPNSTRITFAQYEAVYRLLDAELRARGVRDHVRFMGGDLLGTTSPLGQTQVDWFTFLATRMSDLLDAWSVHIYWEFWDTAKIERRLAEVRAIADSFPFDLRRPLYVTEYGVRGLPTYEGESSGQPGWWPDGTPMSETTVSALQHAWFGVRSAQLGFTGTVKWDLFSARYDAGTQDHSAIGPGTAGWPLRPVYHLLRLFALATEPRGGRVVTMLPRPGVEPTKLVTAYLSPGGNTTVLGLDTRGGLLTTNLFERVDHAIGGLQPHHLYRLLLWNGDGRGTVSEIGFLDSGVDGVVRFTAPLHAVFVVTDANVETAR